MTFVGEVDGPSYEFSQYMQYWTNLEYSSYNIGGKVERHDGWLKTTYDSRYFSKIVRGELPGIEDLDDAGYWLDEEEAILGVTQTLSLVYNNRYVKTQYKLPNGSGFAFDGWYKDANLKKEKNDCCKFT